MSETVDFAFRHLHVDLFSVIPTRAYLEMEIALSQDQISKYADKILLYTNTCMKELRRLFLVQDLVDSLKVCIAHTLAPSKETKNNHYDTNIHIKAAALDKTYICVYVSVCCSDVAADLRGCSLQRPDTAHPR